jgi:DUF917 family protein
MSTEITLSDVAPLALGSAVLGCGGGGNPYYGMLVTRNVMTQTGPVQLIDVTEMPSDKVAVTPAAVGAPLVGIEKPLSIRALQSAYKAMHRSLKDRLGAFVAAEIGGGQSMMPLLQAALTGKPLLDGDTMGRAFPEIQMNTFMIYGFTPGLPIAISNDHGLLLHIPSLPFGKTLKLGGTTPVEGKTSVALERVIRRLCVAMGGLIYGNAAVDQPSLLRGLVRGSISLALNIGRAVEAARRAGGDPVAAIQQVGRGKQLFRGKIVDIERRFHGGQDWGTLKMDGVETDGGRHAELSFKNEYLILRVDGEVVLTVPDLITLVETRTGTPITTEVVRPGLRVSALGLQSTPLLRTPEALRVVGPRAFGYDMDFVPLAGS